MSHRQPPPEGRCRAVVENVAPSVDGGRFPVKRIVGDRVVVEADAFADGHDVVLATLLHRPPGAAAWAEVPMAALDNDRWRAEFPVDRLGRHRYTVTAWVDRFATWRHDLRSRVDAGQDVAAELPIGAALVHAAAERGGADRIRLAGLAAQIAGEAASADRAGVALGDELAALMARHPDRSLATTHDPELEVVVDPPRARFSAWYELFPRSAAPEPGRHGTLRDVVARLPYVAGMGFDVLYLPPIHPVGRTARKGANAVTAAGRDDPGVPWAIGGPEGGHTAIHPELGTLEDFRALVAEADRRGIAIALDLAFQASPDHPLVREHPAWFRHRPDGTVQFAENPPKRYEDIYPFDFESADWRGLWAAMADIARFWIGQGVRIFRVDNPHTKPFPFWAWFIDEIKREAPDVLFLAEAFTRPKVMYRLAKEGFSQSYTYFTWRTTKQELTDYFTELTTSNLREFFRPNLWTNTPDILPEHLQVGGRPAFELRLVLAATLAASYGIYGPAFELGEHRPREAGSEEYLDSEKYQLRHWDLERPDSLAPLITRVNRARREHPALQSNEGLAFHGADDEQVIAYSKRNADRSDMILTVANLDPHAPHAATVELPLETLGLPIDRPFEAVDLLDGTVRLWQGSRNRVALDPADHPAAILHLRPGLRSEHDFEYYL